MMVHTFFHVQRDQIRLIFMFLSNTGRRERTVTDNETPNAACFILVSLYGFNVRHNRCNPSKWNRAEFLMSCCWLCVHVHLHGAQRVNHSNFSKHICLINYQNHSSHWLVPHLTYKKYELTDYINIWYKGNICVVVLTVSKASSTLFNSPAGGPDHGSP